MLSINSASKTFFPGTLNANTALDNMSLKLENGEFVTIIGTNGAGKSTLFNAICGEFYLDKGQIMLSGQDITFLKDFKRAKMVGRVFQDPLRGTAPGLTIAENLAIAYSRSYRHAFQKAIRKKDMEFFKEKLCSLGMGLEDRLATKMGLLSGGQRQAVSLLMSTISYPKLLLLDEHTAALDPAAAEHIVEITRKIVAENNFTALMITHNITQALSIGSRTIMMSKGNIMLDIKGKERENMTIPKLLKLYSGNGASPLNNDRIVFSG